MEEVENLVRYLIYVRKVEKRRRVEKRLVASGSSSMNRLKIEWTI